MSKKKKTLEQLAEEGYLSPIDAAESVRSIAGHIAKYPDGRLVKVVVQIYNWYPDQIKPSLTAPE